MGSRLGNVGALNALVDRSAAVKAAATVVPSNTVDLPNHSANGLWIGVAGDVKVDLLTSGTVIFKAAPVGLLNVDAKRVYATGTTATDILALL